MHNWECYIKILLASFATKTWAGAIYMYTYKSHEPFELRKEKKKKKKKKKNKLQLPNQILSKKVAK